MPKEYITEVSDLVMTHSNAFSNDDLPVAPTGIYSLDFHYWIANKIRHVDDKFHYEGKIGRGFQAQEIYRQARAWMKENEAESA